MVRKPWQPFDTVDDGLTPLWYVWYGDTITLIHLYVDRPLTPTRDIIRLIIWPWVTDSLTVGWLECKEFAHISIFPPRCTLVQNTLLGFHNSLHKRVGEPDKNSNTRHQREVILSENHHLIFSTSLHLNLICPLIWHSQSPLWVQ